MVHIPEPASPGAAIASGARKPLNSCRNCGATSYGPIIERDGSGALRSSGRYRCSGCELVFEQRSEWRRDLACASQPGGSVPEPCQ